jgi:hypothetical protein
MLATRHFLAFLIATIPAVASAAPRDDLLRVVPNDYTFCVVAQNLRDQGKTGGGPFLQRLSEAPLFKLLQQTPEAQKVQQVLDSIFKELDVTPEQLRDDILGDAVVFAYRKGPPGQPEKEDGLILLHARDDKLLARLVDRINEIQTKSGELKAVEQLDGKAGRYMKRVKAVENERPDYYALRGNRLMFCNSEALLTTTLAALDANAKGEPPLVARMKRLAVENAPVVCLINPRSFDPDLGDMAKSGKGSEKSFLREFSKYWHLVDGLALSLNLNPSIEIGLSINVRNTELPKAAATFFAEAGKRSPLWDRVPENAMIAAVGRIDPESFATMFAPFLADDDRARIIEAIADATRPFLETEDFSPLLRGIGPDIGFWITPPDPAEKTWCPQGVLAVKIADNPEGKQAEEAALRGLDFVARLASLTNKGLRVHSEKQGQINVQYLTHTSAFPPGFKPAFASKGGYIVVADSPKSIAKFEAPKGEAKDEAEVPIVRINVSACRDYLQTHRKPLAAFLAGAKGINADEFDRQIDSLIPILETLDKVELVQRSGPDRATFILRLVDAKK